MPYSTNNNHNHDDTERSPSPSHVQKHHDGISPGRHGINHIFAISLNFHLHSLFNFVLTYFTDNKNISSYVHIFVNINSLKTIFEINLGFCVRAMGKF